MSRHFFSPSFISGALYVIFRALSATLRFKENNRAAIDALDARGERMVFCLWHDEMFPLPRVKKQLHLAAMVSPSRDGDILAGVLEKLRFRTVRGSSTRAGAKAMLNAARLMRGEGAHACITVDGPRGPRHRAKPGAVALAFHAEAYVVAVRVRMRPALRFRSWDRFRLPLPFAGITISYGTPWRVDSTVSSPAGASRWRNRLENDLRQLGQEDR